MAASRTIYASVMAGTVTSGPGLLLSSAGEMPDEDEWGLCKARTKNTELKKNSDTTNTNPIRKRSSPLHGGFSAPGLIGISGGVTTGSAGGSICISESG